MNFRLFILFVFLVIVTTASTCDDSLFDYDTVFFVRNDTQDSILVYVGLSISMPPMLPSEEIVPYDPIAPTETEFIAIPTDGPNLFDDLPNDLLEFWIFKTRDFREVPYDSLRADTNLFRLLTFSEMDVIVGDTLVIE